MIVAAVLVVVQLLLIVAGALILVGRLARRLGLDYVTRVPYEEGPFYTRSGSAYWNTRRRRRTPSPGCAWWHCEHRRGESA